MGFANQKGWYCKTLCHRNLSRCIIITAGSYEMFSFETNWHVLESESGIQSIRGLTCFQQPHLLRKERPVASFEVFFCTFCNLYFLYWLVIYSDVSWPQLSALFSYFCNFLWFTAQTTHDPGHSGPLWDSTIVENMVLLLFGLIFTFLLDA